MISDKIRNIVKSNEDVWIMYNVENHDSCFKKFITDKVSSMSACIISSKGIDVFVNELDEYNVKDLDCKIWVCNKKNRLLPKMEDVLKEYNFPKNVYLNYSDSLDVSIDILGHGLYSYITDEISKFYNKNHKDIFYYSAENMICELIESKSENELKYMKLSAKRALQIIEDVFKSTKEGMSEKDIYNLCHKIFSDKPTWFEEYGIVDEKFSWDKEGCPIVLVGENLKKGGHTLPSNQKLTKGNTVYIDFGVTLITYNGEMYSSDLQRMGYCLGTDENDAPKDIKRIFEVLKEAIRLGVRDCRPNVRGYEVDETVRKCILKYGYPDYNHATGHPVGSLAHDVGTSLSPIGSKKSDSLLREDAVYTIEPRIQVENGGSIEEMIQVTLKGGVPLCNMQDKLYLI